MIWRSQSKSNSNPVQKRVSSVSAAIKKISKDQNESIEESIENAYTIKIATTALEKQNVYRLAYGVYRDKRFIPENEKKEYKLKEDDEIGTTVLYIENQHQKIVGSMTLISNLNSSLPASMLYQEEIDQLNGNRIVEFSRFVIAKDERCSKEILVKLLYYSYMYSYHILNVDEMICQVNPSHHFFYKRLMNFKQLGGVKECQKVNDAPAVLMAKNMTSIRNDIEICLKSSNEDKPKRLRRLIYNSFNELSKEELLIEKLIANYNLSK